MSEIRGDAVHHPRSREFAAKVRAHHEELGHSERQIRGVELVTHLTRLVARLVQDFEGTVHRPLGMTWAGFRIMNTLWIFGDLEQREIARISGTSRSSVSSALNTLEDRGLVERRRESDDRRVVRVSLTPAGLALLHKAIAGQTPRETAWTAVLDDDEISQLVSLLGRLVNQEHPA
ncbi:MarR family winged helix-turn-helix transcriptional regulator [Streptomyces sp. MB09-02B]|uniref:MarR family winged helix-turn-helix transcriptional regulator n=1 Tax=Streptomyces sp. MB09-02B TaxID=3028667 RepID=UPI0029ACFD18|nr:MarR family winged helix-turn-helix transcriptional regulator [Streptomyces sp. MB09-02B]MDX3638816.1 MarR family winged helix-turn-helix transcriptional regulator [Streptomyces sp. MB09-02B]